MAKAQLKILAFLITVGLVAGSLSVGWWFYMNVLLKESQVEKDIASMKGKDRPKIDPGVRRFEAAVELIKDGKIEEGREALDRLRLQFPESATVPEAKRIIGEINMDMLYSPESSKGKKDYIVQPGNNLLGIAGKHGTTIDAIVRMNGLMSTMLQPGDHLMLIPLDFHLLVDVSSKEVILQRKVGENFYPFKFYQALELRLPPGTRVPVELELAGKNASFEGKTLLPTDPNYAATEKWMAAKKHGSTSAGIVIRTLPAPQPPKALPVEQPAKKSKAGKSAKNAPADDAQPPLPLLEAEPGVFLSRADIEEIFALVRIGSKVSFKR